VLAAFLSLFYLASSAPRPDAKSDRAGPTAFRECVNATLPGWAAVKVDRLTATPRRAGRDGDEGAATLYFDRAGRVRALREGPAAMKRGEPVVIAGIFEWGVRVSSSAKHQAETAAAGSEDGAPSYYVDVDLAFDTLDCSVVRSAWAELFEPVEPDVAQQRLDGPEEPTEPSVGLTTADATGHR
jgi:hypothetical protein